MITFAEISRLGSRDYLQEILTSRYQSNTEALVSEINRSVNHLLHADLKEAEKYIAKLKPFFKHLPLKFRPRGLAMEARFEHWSGRSISALNKYQKAVNDLTKYHDFESAARTRQGLMDVLMYIGRHDDAIKTGKKALRYFRRSGNMALSAKIMTNIGNVYHRLDKNHLALGYYNKAREQFVETGGFPLALVDYNRANIYSNYNDIRKAEELYKSASKIYQDIGMVLGVGKAEYSLAYLYFLDNRYSTSLRAFEKVYEAFIDLGDIKSASVCRLDIAEIHIHLNQYSASLYYCEEALKMLKKCGLRYEQGKAHYFMAESYRKLGDLHKAEQSLKIADSLFKKEKNHLWKGMIQLCRSRIKTSDGKTKAALISADNAKKLFTLSGDERRKIDAQITIIRIYLNDSNAKSAFQRAHGLLHRDMISSQKRDLYEILGDYHLKYNRPDTALDYYKRGIDITEKMIVNLYPDEIRFFFAADKYPLYLNAVTCLLRLGRVDESFIQHSQALSVMNSRQLADKVIEKEIPREYLDNRSKLRVSLKKYNQMVTGTRHLISSTKDIQATERKLWSQERKIRVQLYGQENQHNESLCIDAGLNRKLKAGETLISFVAHQDSIGAFVVKKSKIDYIQLPVSAEKLHAAVRELHFLMEKDVYAPSITDGSEAINKYLKGISGWLINPIRELLSEKIIFLADGLFAQIPFAALPLIDGKLLSQKYDFRIIVNPKDLLQRKTSSQGKVTGRSAVFAPENKNLAMIELENQMISELFTGVNSYTGKTAVSENLKLELEKSKGFVHIASHASRSSENPLFSKIMLDDGPFFPFDLFGGGINARLVCLSGCQTAAPGIYFGNSFSLAKAFYQAGAQFVLASLWPVSDKVSLVFMTEFYKALKRNKNIYFAYSKAVSEVRAVNPNPAFWSPFILIGL
ncbi:MAG: CHAT domain-containing protein [candidate division Zixibacteria bacterium]|nr:CHAT domain-containing protein [candidate division Zixibacteria bacterium]